MTDPKDEQKDALTGIVDGNQQPMPDINVHEQVKNELQDEANEANTEADNKLIDDYIKKIKQADPIFNNIIKLSVEIRNFSPDNEAGQNISNRLDVALDAWEQRVRNNLGIDQDGKVSPKDPFASQTALNELARLCQTTLYKAPT